MINPGELKRGITIELDGVIYQVLDYQHIKVGRGSAQVRLRLRDLRGGHTLERVFQAGEKFRLARLDQHTAQYLYQDADLYYFMDEETFEQFPVNREQLRDALSYLKEGLALTLLSHEGQTVGVELPITVDLRVTDAPPSFKGDTAQSGTKPATLETGLVVQVPFHINRGDMVRVDTRTGNYLERVT